MTKRGALVVGSTLAAALVSGVTLFAFLPGPGALSFLPVFADDLFVLVGVPVLSAAAVSSAWVSASKRFESRGHLANAIRICLLAYPILFPVLWATIWAWLQFERFLPLHDRPGSLLRMAETAGSYTMLAFVVGILPSIFVEYFVIRSIRVRYASVGSFGVAS